MGYKALFKRIVFLTRAVPRRFKIARRFSPGWCGLVRAVRVTVRGTVNNARHPFGCTCYGCGGGF